MDLFTLDTTHLRPVDLDLFRRLEADWAREHSLTGLAADNSTWSVQLRWRPEGERVAERARLEVDHRAWALLACIQLYLEWRVAEAGDPRQAVGCYTTLQEWMAGQLYGVFPSDERSTAVPLRLTYGDWLRYGIDISLQKVLFGRILLDCGRASQHGDPKAAFDWAAMIDRLVAIAGSLPIAAALAHLPNPQIDSVGSYRDVYLRGRALRFGARSLPEWVGETVSAQDECRVLARLQAQLRTADADDLVAIEWYGISLSVDLSDTAWSAVRKLVASEQHRRSLGPTVQWSEQPEWKPRICVN